LPQLPLLEATFKAASTFPYKHSNPSLTTHLSGANPACQVALDRQGWVLVGQMRGKGSKLGEGEKELSWVRGKESKLGEGGNELA
jgi:hypothetical protein